MAVVQVNFNAAQRKVKQLSRRSIDDGHSKPRQPHSKVHSSDALLLPRYRLPARRAKGYRLHLLLLHLVMHLVMHLLLLLLLLLLLCQRQRR